MSRVSLPVHTVTIRCMSNATVLTIATMGGHVCCKRCFKTRYNVSELAKLRNIQDRCKHTKMLRSTCIPFSQAFTDTYSFICISEHFVFCARDQGQREKKWESKSYNKKMNEFHNQSRFINYVINKSIFNFKI